MNNGHWDNGMGSGAWWWIPMTIMMVAFWGALIWLAVALIRRPNHNLHAAPGPIAQTPAASPRLPTGPEILAERLARGEIEPDEYRLRLDALNQTIEPRPESTDDR